MKQRSAAEVANPVHELIEKRAKTTTTTIFLQRKQQFVWGAHSSLARSLIHSAILAGACSGACGSDDSTLQLYWMTAFRGIPINLCAENPIKCLAHKQ